MDFNLLLRNRGVRRVLVGVPEGGDSLAARIETASGDVITLQEPTLAALARAYLQVTTHPTVRAVELVATAVHDRKDGFDEVQLLDSGATEAEVQGELAAGPPSSAPMTSRAEPVTAPPSKPSRPRQPPPDDEDDLELELDPDDSASLSPRGPSASTSLSLLDDSTTFSEGPTPKPRVTAKPVSPQALPTEHGRPPEDDELDLEQDDLDEEPIFGDVPTQHSKPRKKR